MPIHTLSRPTHTPTQQQRPWPSPTGVLVEPRPGEWC
jgi:hypothetical protein